MQIQINLNLSQERHDTYLAALRKRFHAPKRGWSWLVRALIREAVAEQDPRPVRFRHLPSELFQVERHG